MTPRIAFFVALMAFSGSTAVEASGRDPTRPDAIASSPGLTLQAALDRAGFSPGQIDGRAGPVTKRALAAFQEEHGLAPTGEVDDETWTALGVEPGDSAGTVTRYSISKEDEEGPFTSEIPDDMEAQSKLSALGYTSVVEALAERFHTAPALLKALNPEAEFVAGEAIIVPQVGISPPAGDVTDVTVSVSESTEVLTVRDSEDKILMFAPVTVGSERDPLPIGRWKVTGVTRNPTFSYNPDLFWDADPSHGKAQIPAGPNNPVGVVWIDLDRPHFGIHGTPEPGKIGYRESHGCVRLTNWDALKLAGLVKPGTAVVFHR